MLLRDKMSLKQWLFANKILRDEYEKYLLTHDYITFSDFLKLELIK